MFDAWRASVHDQAQGDSRPRRLRQHLHLCWYESFDIHINVWPRGRAATLRLQFHTAVRPINFFANVCADHDHYAVAAGFSDLSSGENTANTTNTTNTTNATIISPSWSSSLNQNMVNSAWAQAMTCNSTICGPVPISGCSGCMGAAVTTLLIQARGVDWLVVIYVSKMFATVCCDAPITLFTHQ